MPFTRVRVPFDVVTFFPVAKQVMDPVTLAKINVLDKDNEKAKLQLLEEIESNNVHPLDFGTGPTKAAHTPSFMPDSLVYVGLPASVKEDTSDAKLHEVEDKVRIIISTNDCRPMKNLNKLHPR